MAIKKDIKAWAIKLRGRSFYQGTDGNPFLYPTQLEARNIAHRVSSWKEVKIEVVRVRVRIEEIE